jgi:undecaprenyl-diphosphatase
MSRRHKTLFALGTVIASVALLSQIQDPQQFLTTIGRANLAWLGVALVISFLTNFATAVSLMGAVPMGLPLLRTAELQLSMSFSNLAVPGVGGVAAQVRFVQKRGMDLASAVSSGGVLAGAGNLVAQLLLLVAAMGLSRHSAGIANVDTRSLESGLFVASVVALVAGGLLFRVRRIRDKAVPPIERAAATIAQALRSPRRVLMLVAGNMINAVMYALVLGACIAAFGGGIAFWTLLSVNILVGSIASLVPVPGAGTAVSSIGLVGALTAAGMPTEIAVAGVLLDQFVTTIIPAVPGWFATGDLLRDGYL